jgi:hypothetical protein
MKHLRTVRFINKNDDAADANQASQTAFYNQLTANYSSDYTDFEGAEKTLQSQLQPIVAAGPSQDGFSAAETNSLDSTAISTGAAAATNAEQAANQQITASNGGAALMPTGAQDQLKQEADITSAQNLSSNLQGIQQAGYTQGVQNYDTALSAESGVLGLMNPNSYAGAATGAGSAATGAVNAATSAAQASDSWMSLVGGALGGATGALTSYGLNTLKPSTSSSGIPAAQAPYGPNSD